MWQQFNFTITQLLLKTLNHLDLISLLFFFTATGCCLCVILGLRVKVLGLFFYMTDYDKMQNIFAPSYLISFLLVHVLSIRQPIKCLS